VAAAKPAYPKARAKLRPAVGLLDQDLVAAGDEPR